MADKLYGFLVVKVSLFGQDLNRLESIKHGAAKVVNQVNDLESGDQPVKVLQLPFVQVPVGQPVGPIRPSAELVHQGDQSRAGEVPHSDRRPEQRNGRAPHALRSLVVQELQVPDRHVCLSYSVQAVLRDQPEDRNGQGEVLRVVEEPVGGGDVFPFDFHETGDESGEDGDHEPDSHPLEVRDPAVEACEFSRQGDEGPVVEDDGGEHGRVGEDGHGGGRDFERFREASVHGCHQDDPGRPYRPHSDDALQLLHPVDRVQSPQVGRHGVVVLGHQGGLIKKPALENLALTLPALIP
uniref:Uncharacterized protein n=1 Tax=Kalanchoe fedtschenkoi TaxID=63787 RepID=A0A7N0UL91_KALFE